MKKIDELGISPWPWECHKQFVIAKDDGSVVAASNYRDARLIASAPELYECLHELIEMHECCDAGCEECPYHPCGEKEHDIILKSKNALAKASGESEVGK